MNIKHELKKLHVVRDVGEVTLTWFIEFLVLFFAIEKCKFFEISIAKDIYP